MKRRKSSIASTAPSPSSNAAVAAARVAQPAWADMPPIRRARIMNKFLALMEQHRDTLAAMITAEHGKVYTDAQGEVTRGIDIIEFACGIPQLLKGDAELLKIVFQNLLINAGQASEAVALLDRANAVLRNAQPGAANAALVAGTGVFSINLRTAGSQTVSAADVASALSTGTSASVTVSASARMRSGWICSRSSSKMLLASARTSSAFSMDASASSKDSSLGSSVASISRSAG